MSSNALSTSLTQITNKRFSNVVLSLLSPLALCDTTLDLHAYFSGCSCLDNIGLTNVNSGGLIKRTDSDKSLVLTLYWDLSAWGDSNPHPFRDWYLKPARLPIPPQAEICNPVRSRTVDSTVRMLWNTTFLQGHLRHYGCRCLPCLYNVSKETPLRHAWALLDSNQWLLACKASALNHLN